MSIRHIPPFRAYFLQTAEVLPICFFEDRSATGWRGGVGAGGRAGDRVKNGAELFDNRSDSFFTNGRSVGLLGLSILLPRFTDGVFGRDKDNDRTIFASVTHIFRKQFMIESWLGNTNAVYLFINKIE